MSVDCVTYRFFNVYGRGQNPEYAGAITRFASRLARKLPPTVYGDGTQSRDFVHIEDVVDAIVLALSKDMSGTFNIVTGKPITIEHIARLMIKAYGLDMEPEYTSPQKSDIIHSVASVERSQHSLGFVAGREITRLVR